MNLRTSENHGLYPIDDMFNEIDSSHSNLELIIEESGANLRLKASPE